MTQPIALKGLIGVAPGPVPPSRFPLEALILIAGHLVFARRKAIGDAHLMLGRGPAAPLWRHVYQPRFLLRRNAHGELARRNNDHFGAIQAVAEALRLRLFRRRRSSLAC